MSVCIQYSRPASGSTDSEVFGFDVAVTNFLSAYFRSSTVGHFLCRPTDLDSFEHFKATAQAAGIDAETRCIGLDPRHPKENLSGITCLFRPDPLTTDLIWQRQQLTGRGLAGRGYATCGLVHTMSGVRIAEAVGNLCLAPSDNTDALICPSHAIRDAVQRLWEINTDYLNHRFGGKFKCPMQTPVIPLGIDTAKFTRLTTADKRAAQRAALQVSDDETVILFVGRLSFATKAHPLPLFMAAERAAQQTRQKICLVMYGYFMPRDMENHFRALATDLCPSVRVEFVLNDDKRFPDGVWAAGDIFTSLSDNVQESFGLTPIEAMACGMPVVISDWDGYREGPRNGVEGFLIPTQTPPPAAGQAIGDFYYNQNNYGVALTGASQSTSLDIQACGHAFAVLVHDVNLCRIMGEAGRMRARAVFDWPHIIRAYEDLWHSLSEQRQTIALPPALPDHWPAAHPAYPNPWDMFASFPTTHLRPTDFLRIAADAATVDTIMKHEMNYFVPDLLLSKEQMKELIGVIRNAGAVRIGDLLAPFPVPQHDLLWRCIGWMLKHGVCFSERHSV